MLHHIRLCTTQPSRVSMCARKVTLDADPDLYPDLYPESDSGSECPFGQEPACVLICQFCLRAGESEVPGLTDESKPRLRGPKRASKIRKLFNLTKEDDVRKYVNVFRKVRGRTRAGA